MHQMNVANFYANLWNVHCLVIHSIHYAEKKTTQINENITALFNTSDNFIIFYLIE